MLWQRQTKDRLKAAITNRQWLVAGALSLLLITLVVLSWIATTWAQSWTERLLDEWGPGMIHDALMFLSSETFRVLLFGSVPALIVWLYMRRSSRPDNRTLEASEPVLVPTLDQIAERQLFIDRLRAASIKLEENTHYNSLGSIAHRLNELHSDPVVKELIAKDDWLGWVMSLLEQRATSLAMRCWDSEKRSDALSPSTLSDEGIHQEVGRIADSFLEYGQLTTNQFMGLLASFEKRGVSQFWKSAPWPDVITKLAGDYNELVRLIKDLRNATPTGARSRLPRDDQMGYKFPKSLV